MTIYGRLDAGYASQVDTTAVAGVARDVKSSGVTSHNNASSYFGLTGSEDLGGGLSANFKLEADLLPATGAQGASGADSGFAAVVTSQADRASTGGFNRTALLGVKGGFGELNFGRDYTPTFSLGAATDVNKQSYLTTVALAAGVGSTVARQIQYTSPSLNGVVVKIASGNTDQSATGAQLANGGVNAATGAYDIIARNTSATVTYSNGPLMLGLGIGTQESVGVAGTATPTVATASITSKNEMSILAGSYDLGFAKLVGNYITVKNTPNTSVSADSTSTETNLGVVVPVGALSLIGQVGRNTFSSNVPTGVPLIGAANTGSTGILAGDRSGNDFVLGAEYTLSKRTLAYVKTGVTNKLEGLQNNVQLDTKRTVSSIGILHTF